MAVDPVAAVVTRLKSKPAVVAAVGDVEYISDMRPQDAEPNRKHIAVLASGGPGNHPDIPLGTRRLDIWCYGETPGEATAVAGEVYSALIPPSRTGMAFVAASCRIFHVKEVAGISDLVDEGWPANFSRFEVSFIEVAAGA